MKNLTRTRFLSVASLAACGMALAACGMYGDKSGGKSAAGGGTSAMGAAAARTSAGQFSAADREFAMKAAAEGMYEVEASRLAVSRTSNAQIKSFAQMMIDDHTAANNELAGVMRAKGMTPPSALPSEQQSKLSRLRGLSGAEFEREYVRAAGVQDHQTDIALFERASREASDPQLKAWASKTLPVLRKHLQTAQTIAGTMAG